MKFTEFLKRMFVIYFVIVTCINAVMGVMGLVFFPNMRFGYDAFFSPLICGLISILPSFLLYSKKELSFHQVIVRKTIQYILIVFLLVLINSLSSSWEWSSFIPLVFSIFLVCIMVELVIWIMDYKKAEELSKYLKSYQKKNS